MNSKRKTHIWSCQMCIKTVKTRQKREKLKGAPPWTPTKAWER